jgi:hypothetical protein
VFTELGRNFNSYWDVAWYEKPVGAAPDADLDNA